MSKSLRNTTGSTITINDTGVSIGAGITYPIPPQDYPLWSASVNVDTRIASGDLVVNDGYDDLKPELGLKHIHEETVPRSTALILSAVVQATAASTLTLTASSKLLYFFTGTTAGQIVKLPNATTLNNGHRFEVWNTSNQFITIQNNGSTPVFSMSAQQKSFCLLQDNSTSNGVWQFEANFLGGTGGGNGPIVFGFDGNASTGRWLELATNVPTNLTKGIVAGSKTLRAVSFGTNGNSTCTVTIYRNGSAIETISTSATSKNTKLNLAHILLDKDELSARVTAGSCVRPVAFAWL